MKPQQWEISLKENDSGELILPLPNELMLMQGWCEGDILEWVENGDGTWTLQKAE